MNNNDLAFTPALELAQLIRLREVSPLELVEVYLEPTFRTSKCHIFMLQKMLLN